MPGTSLPVPGVLAQRWWSPHSGFDQLAAGHMAQPLPSIVPLAPVMVMLVSSLAEISGFSIKSPGCVPLFPSGGSMCAVP